MNNTGTFGRKYGLVTNKVAWLLNLLLTNGKIRAYNVICVFKERQESVLWL